jgi:hypothetical protein
MLCAPNIVEASIKSKVVSGCCECAASWYLKELLGIDHFLDPDEPSALAIDTDQAWRIPFTERFWA